MGLPDYAAIDYEPAPLKPKAAGDWIRDRAMQTKEADPTGRNQHQPGAKVDAGKPRPGLVLGAFSGALLEVTKVGTFGAQKYTDHGWLTVPNGFNRYEDAQMRHALYRHSGESHDPDSGLLHLAHEAWNALAKLELYLQSKRGSGEQI